VRSKGEARRTVAEGGAYVNNQRVTDPELVPGRDQLLHGSWLVLRRGKKHLAGVEVVHTAPEQAADLREPGL
jgi:tyrosyl-tRNA synthetase